MAVQQEFDFSDRGYRRRLLQDFTCPDVVITEGTARPVRRRMKARDLKAILRVIEDFGVVCYASMATIAESADCDRSHVKRCIRALREIGLLAEIRLASGIEYRIVYSEIAAAICARSRRSDVPRAIPGGSATENPIDRPHVRPSVRPSDRPSDRPTDGPTDGPTVGPQTTGTKEQETTTTAKTTRGVESSDSPQTERIVVVVSSLGVGRAREAVSRALSQGLTPEAIECRIAAFRALPAESRRGGTLYNWLALPRSFDGAQIGGGEVRLQLATMSGDDERRRADLIRYGRGQGWTHEQLQIAIRRFEHQCLAKERSA
ncbi:PT domain-containing protein [Aureliella helgolandensis]|uniref:Helix-turn-helix domain-containing protein n=1 Tax=Aureliella helgolandensis TaxID=2527968 RepID=A0A518G2Q5_9BACT|nr:PT domain-containing protein [Aureliella helgolandensis]QDV22883.1 hypothetical protein Q31a_11760 [Aureliella helgolandensis]